MRQGEDLAAAMVIPAQTGVVFPLCENECLQVIDPEGQQVADLFCVARHDLEHTLSCGRSLDYADTILLTRGHTLYSHRSEPMLTILEDSCGRHDLLMTPCSRRMFEIVDPLCVGHPSCHENLERSFKPWGIRGDQITNTFNIFMNVAVAASGRVSIHPPLSKAGSHVLLRAHMDLLVGLTACSHEETNAGRCKPIFYKVLPQEKR